MTWIVAQIRKPIPNEISLVITDDQGIADIHERFLDDAKPTDVISFNYNNLPGQSTGSAGEIIVNVERAKKYRNPSRELALYLAHGCDHLSGESDHTPRLRARMRRRELAWLREAEKLKLLDKLIFPERK